MIYFNGKEITPKLNGVNLSRVMYNGERIWSNKEIRVDLNNENRIQVNEVNEDSLHINENT